MSGYRKWSEIEHKADRPYSKWVTRAEETPHPSWVLAYAQMATAAALAEIADALTALSAPQLVLEDPEEKP